MNGITPHSNPETANTNHKPNLLQRLSQFVISRNNNIAAGDMPQSFEMLKAEEDAIIESLLNEENNKEV